ncbi:MAG: hypothetical protein P4L98_09355 [Ancalomicrobiaceae bacterium]|nr:hypothetical protein [Ancalomicrobiaceae bacterium]
MKIVTALAAIVLVAGSVSAADARPIRIGNVGHVQKSGPQFHPGFQGPSFHGPRYGYRGFHGYRHYSGGPYIGGPYVGGPYYSDDDDCAPSPLWVLRHHHRSPLGVFDGILRSIC